MHFAVRQERRLELDDRLGSAFARASPRLSPEVTPWASWAIHGGVLALFVGLFARAFFGGGVFAWSIGLIYVAYDTVLLGFVFWQTLGLRRDGTTAAPAMPARLVVVVAAHNEAVGLPATLAALFAQAHGPDLVVIADDGSNDGTAEYLCGEQRLALPAIGGSSRTDAAAFRPALQWLRLPRGGKARALNAAISGLDCDIVLTVDADTLLAPGAVGAMRAAFSRDADLVAATGVLNPVCHGGLGARVLQGFQTYEYIRNFLSRAAWARLDCLLLISGAFAGFRMSSLRQVGGFDPQCLVEDYELIHRMRRHSALAGLGWQTAVLGNATSRTSAPATVAAFLRQRRRWFGGFLQTQYWYREMVGNRRYGWLGLAMLPVKAIDTLQPLYGIAAFGLLIGFLLGGYWSVALPALGVMGGKLAIDLSFHLWSVRLYRRWTGARAGLGGALLAAAAEPFSFQLLRHLGAAWGWVVFLRDRGRSPWTPVRETA